MCRKSLPTVFYCLFIGLFPAFATWGHAAEVAKPTGLEAVLLDESPSVLAKEARRRGDAAAGAMIFHSPALACATCHSNGAGDTTVRRVGPNLAELVPPVSDEELVESVLRPSHKIQKGFETTKLLTSEGQVITGILVTQTDENVVMRDPSTNKEITFPANDIEEVVQSELSIMPAGLVNQLAGRQAFLDLLRYLIEIKEGGIERAIALQPEASLLAVQPLPEYEQRVDHAGMIRQLDDEAFDRGEVIYKRLCINCHGTVTEQGSLPTSLRFASGVFKNGNGPYAMYQTLTHGFGLMTAQRWMVPMQKYDVIHYIRTAYLKEHNPTQYAKVNDTYLASLPTGDTFGPEPVDFSPWQQMDYGPNLIATYEIGDDGSNFAYKGNAIRLDAGPGGISQGKHRFVYDLDTMRVAAAYSGDGFIDWNGINFNGSHGTHPRIVGDVIFQNLAGPGWADPRSGSFEDTRLVGRDGRRYGPLPHEWMHYRGMYASGSDTLLSYSVGGRNVVEMPAVNVRAEFTDFQRNFQVEGSTTDLKLQVMQFSSKLEGLSTDVSPDGLSATVRHKLAGSSELRTILVSVTGKTAGLSLEIANKRCCLNISGQKDSASFTMHHALMVGNSDAGVATKHIASTAKSIDLAAMQHGGTQRWPSVLETTVESSVAKKALAVDTINYPANNPWFCRMRLTGFDFMKDGQTAAVCDWDGNVWLVRGLSNDKVTWQRIASGLFQPLGLKIVDSKIFVSCRDQICILHDLNGDGETDFYENFNNDHQVTEHFHEFAMGLQTDGDGNFYYAKSACHARVAVVPHHGTLLKVSKDGSKTEIIATGFRAANGVCLNDDGTFFVTDQEGHWNPKNRINWVRQGGFYGNMWGYHDITDTSDSAMEQPLCWITNAFDRSPAELLWVPKNNWGPLAGSLLNLSYGYGKVYIVPHERKGDRMQGGMCELPIPQFPTGVMRGRFNPADGQLYLAGMFAWAGTQEQDGGFYRVRYTDQAIHVPLGLNAKGNTLTLRFSGEMDPSSVKPSQFEMSRWSLLRSNNYGSDHFDTEEIQAASAELLEDRRTVRLTIPDLKPTWCMEIKYKLQSAEGQVIVGKIDHTIHSLE